MKKRRELDALVNGKTNGRRKRKGQHDLLLENMSDSSDIEEFSVPGKTVVRKYVNFVSIINHKIFVYFFSISNCVCKCLFCLTLCKISSPN